jgi:cardiolipin synthase A/B
MHRWRVVLIVVVALFLAGCQGFEVSLQGHSKAQAAKHSAPTDDAAQTGTAGQPVTASSGALQLLVEPQAGVKAIYALITGAKKSIELTMYELRDTTAEDDLAAAAKRGVDVQVILDAHLEKSRNTATYSYLKAHRVHVTWAPSGTTYHQKTLTVDGKTSIIMTLNMVSSDYAGTRDFAVIDTSKADVRAIVTTFNADFAHKKITPPVGSDLVWSPTNSQATILAVINGAKKTLAVENEEMDDPTITTALEKAAKRGVDVTIVMTAESEWDTAFSALVKAGAHVHLFADSSSALYIHAKTVVADSGRSDERVFLGSENFSAASLNHNRELGILSANKTVIGAIAKVVAADYADSKAY